MLLGNFSSICPSPHVNLVPSMPFLVRVSLLAGVHNHVLLSAFSEINLRRHFLEAIFY
jgi:hypothetical protein